MQSIVDFLYMVDDMLWGTPMVVIVLGTGIFLSLRFGFSYQRKLKFNIKNTFGNMTAAGEGVGTVSSFRAACTGLANTVGTGNISGVATAIVSGGPGALVWMWVSAFFGMSTKACEIILGQRYREHYKNSMDEYVCDRSFVMKNAFGWKRGAIVLAVFAFVLGPWHLLRTDRGSNQLHAAGLRRDTPHQRDNHRCYLYCYDFRRSEKNF